MQSVSNPVKMKTVSYTHLSQQVLDTWGISWETYMASLGYIVVCVDGRGTGGRGEAFEKCTYLKIGVKEAKDQVETALYLGKQPYVDKDRIGIWGWSYGGYMTLMSMSEGTPVFLSLIHILIQNVVLLNKQFKIVIL